MTPLFLCGAYDFLPLNWETLKCPTGCMWSTQRRAIKYAESRGAEARLLILVYYHQWVFSPLHQFSLIQWSQQRALNWVISLSTHGLSRRSKVSLPLFCSVGISLPTQTCSHRHCHRSGQAPIPGDCHESQRSPPGPQHWDESQPRALSHAASLE